MRAQVVDVDDSTLQAALAVLGDAFKAERRGGVFPFLWGEGFTADTLDALVLLYERVTLDVGRVIVSPELTDKLSAYAEAGIVSPVRLGNDAWTGVDEHYPFESISTDFIKRELEVEGESVWLPAIIDTLSHFQLAVARRQGLQRESIDRSMAELRRYDRAEGSNWAYDPVSVVNRTAEVGIWAGLFDSVPLTNRVLRYAWPDVLSGAAVMPLDDRDRVTGALGEWIGDIKEGLPRYENAETVLKVREEGGEEGFLDAILSSAKRDDELGDKALSRRLSRTLDQKIALAQRVESPSFDAPGVTLAAGITAFAKRGLLAGRQVGQLGA